MKFRDPATGKFKELYTKAADTLPVGSVVDYEGTSVPAGWEEVEVLDNNLKRIRKKEPSVGTLGKIVNSLADSKQDTYSCDYLNKKIEVVSIDTAETDLNNYIKTGVYYFRGSDVIPNNIPAGSNGWLIVLEGTSNTHIKQIWYRLGSEPNHYQTYIRTCLSGIWSKWQRMVVFNDIYYEDGDTYEIGASYEIISGFVSNGGARLYLDFKVPRLLSNINRFTVDNFHIRNLRGINGYFLQNSTEVEFNVTPYIINENTIEVAVEKTDGTPFDIINNTPICAEILNTKFTFKE